MPWEDESYSNNVVEVKNKKKKRAERTRVSDDVPKGDDNNKDVKEKSMDVKKQNLKFTPPKRAVGMYKHVVNCALEPPPSQFDNLREVFPSAGWIIL